MYEIRNEKEFYDSQTSRSLIDFLTKHLQDAEPLAYTEASARFLLARHSSCLAFKYESAIDYSRNALETLDRAYSKDRKFSSLIKNALVDAEVDYFLKFVVIYFPQIDSSYATNPQILMTSSYNTIETYDE